MAFGSSKASHCTGANGHILCPVLLGTVEMPNVSLPTWESSQVVTHGTDVGLQKNSVLESCDLAQLPLQCIVAAPSMGKGSWQCLPENHEVFFVPSHFKSSWGKRRDSSGQLPWVWRTNAPRGRMYLWCHCSLHC